MSLQELLVNKNNIFEHLLYEFRMYLETYARLRKHIHEKNGDSILKNMILESHAVHLRNLIEFFNREKDCITTETIFLSDHNLMYDDSKMKAKQIVNKTVDHLTKERYTWNQTEKDLTVRYATVVHYVFPEIASRIIQCVDLLSQETDIRPEYTDDLHGEKIQQDLRQLASICNIIREVVQ